MIEPPIPVHNEMSAATLRTLMYVGEQAALAAMPPSRGFSLKPGRCEHEPEENRHDVVECLITQKAERRAALRLIHPWPRKPNSRTSMSKFREARVHAKCRTRHRKSGARTKDVSDRSKKYSHSMSFACANAVNFVIFRLDRDRQSSPPYGPDLAGAVRVKNALP